MALSSLRPLRNRSFAAFFFAGVVSNIGTWMQTVAVGALVAERTGSAALTGLVAVAAFLPIGLFSPIGGALADRIDRVRFMIIANLLEVGIAGLLTVLAVMGEATPWRVTGLVLIEGCIASLRLPFYQALLPDLVSRDDLLAAASLGSASYNMGRVVGPALGAAVVAATGSYAWAFGINALSFFAVIWALFVIRVPARTVVDDGSSVLGRIRAGARAARDEPGCWAAIRLIAITAFLASPFIALVPIRAHELSGGGKTATATLTGALTTAQGIGAVLGALAIAPLADRLGRRRLLTSYLVISPLLIIVYGLQETAIGAVISLVAVGAAYIGILSGLSTVVQLRAPADFRGRILSLYFVSLGVIYPIGVLIQGPVADRLGLQETTIGTSLLLLAFLGVLGLARPEVFRVLDAPEAEPLPAPARESAAEVTRASQPAAGAGAAVPAEPAFEPEA